METESSFSTVEKFSTTPKLPPRSLDINNSSSENGDMDHEDSNDLGRGQVQTAANMSPPFDDLSSQPVSGKARGTLVLDGLAGPGASNKWPKKLCMLKI